MIATCLYQAEGVYASDYCTSKTLKLAPIASRQVVSVKSFGAKGDGRTDDFWAIQSALNSAQPGSVVIFPAGTYRYSRVLTLKKTNVVLQGKGGILQATNPAAQAIQITGDNSALLGMKIRGVVALRSGKPETAMVWVNKAKGVQLVNNDVQGGASASIFMYGAQDFRIVGNTVHGGQADGIHMTANSQRGLVEYNTVYGTGDDMIAVVSYCGREPGIGSNPVSGVMVRHNNVSANTWGRGITVVGGRNVAITDNNVADVWGAAGILVAQEGSYNTCGVSGVLVKNNSIARIQTVAPPVGKIHTKQAAIDVNSSNQRPVEYVQIEGNRVTDAGYAGIRLLDNITHVRILNNDVRGNAKKAKEPSVKIERSKDKVDNISCVGNNADGQRFTPPSTQCTTDQNKDRWPAFDFATPQGKVWEGCL